MIIVTTKAELKSAIESKKFPISCRGAIAEQLRKNKKRSRAAKIGGAALAVVGIATLPFTGGMSATGIAMGATAMGLTVGTVTISAAELAILVGGGVAVLAILKGRKIRLEKDGSVTVE